MTLPEPSPKPSSALPALPGVNVAADPKDELLITVEYANDGSVTVGFSGSGFDIEDDEAIKDILAIALARFGINLPESD